MSRDDSGSFLPAYAELDIVPNNPFASIDQKGVGRLMEITRDLGRKTRPKIKLGICGEHGGEPSSVKFCHDSGSTTSVAVPSASRSRNSPRPRPRSAGNESTRPDPDFAGSRLEERACSFPGKNNRNGNAGHREECPQSMEKNVWDTDGTVSFHSWSTVGPGSICLDRSPFAPSDCAPQEQPYEKPTSTNKTHRPPRHCLPRPRTRRARRRSATGRRLSEPKHR